MHVWGLDYLTHTTNVALVIFEQLVKLLFSKGAAIITITNHINVLSTNMLELSLLSLDTTESLTTKALLLS